MVITVLAQPFVSLYPRSDCAASRVESGQTATIPEATDVYERVGACVD
jgi:hypothetical protein